MIKEKVKIITKVSTKKTLGNPLKYDNYATSMPPISESLKRDLDEALREAHDPKSRKSTLDEILVSVEKKRKTPKISNYLEPVSSSLARELDEAWEEMQSPEVSWLTLKEILNNYKKSRL